MDTGPGGAAFSNLLQQLNDQHQREVAELNRTIQDLQRTIDKVSKVPSQTVQPRGDNDALDDGPRQGAQSSRMDDVERIRLEADNERSPSKENRMEMGGGLGEDNTGRMVNIDTLTATPELPQSQPRGSKNRPGIRTSSSLQMMTAEGPSRGMMLIDSVIGSIILANIILIFVRLEYQGYVTAVQLEIQEPGQWPDLDLFFEVMQHVFCAIFLVELIARLAVFRLEYFYSIHGLEKFNIFDAVIVLFTCIDLYIIAPFVAGGKGSDLTVIRAMRFVRLLRAMRVVRTFEIFSKLRVLFSTVAASFFALLWSMVLLFITMLMAALVLTQIVNPYLTEPGISRETVMFMFMHYGTAGRSLWTVFEMTFSGGWPQYARPLVEEVSSGFAWFFALYISTVVFAMTRIITALFLKDTLAVAANDADMMIQEKTKEKKMYAEKLLDFFNAADTSGDGKITLDEFEEFVEDPRVRTYLTTLEIDASETKNLFLMLDDGDGSVTAEEFVQGAVRLKGVARSQDVVSIMHDFAKMNRKIDSLSSKMEATSRG